MGKIIRVEKRGYMGSQISVMSETNNIPEGWEGKGAVVILGDRGCWIENLAFKGLDESEATEVFESLSSQPPTESDAVDTIVDRCRARGISVVPGETTRNQDGQWTFRGWRLSR